MIVNKINQFLSEEGKSLDEAILSDVSSLARFAFERQFGAREPSVPSLRLSSIGHCLRQQAYTLLDFPANGKEIDARARMVFFMGDLTEMAVLALAEAAGCEVSKTGMDQVTVYLDGIAGHPDGLLRESGATFLIEVKSMSSYAFGDFERGILDDGYRYQINAYLEALNLDKCVVVALNKDAGVLSEMIVSKDAEIVQDIRLRIESLKQASLAELPERPYAPDAKGYLPWQCRYCSHYTTCWPTSELKLVGKSYKLFIPKEESHAAEAKAKVGV